MAATTRTNATKPAKPAKSRVNNAVKIDAKNPIPFEYDSTAFTYVNSFRYLPFLNPDDTFAKTLLEAKTLSPTQSACINTKTKFCTGKGLKAKDDKEFTPEMTNWLKFINARNESATTICRKAFGSFFTFGNAPIEVVRLTVGKRRFLYVYAHNFIEWRKGWPDKKTGLIRHAINSKLFLNKGIIRATDLQNARQIPIYNPSQPDNARNWFKDENGVERTLIWLQNDTEGYDDYGMPSSVSSLLHQVLEYKHARFNLDMLENGMVIGGILVLNGNLSQTEADKIGKIIINSHTGDGKRGRTAVLSTEEGDITGSEYHDYKTQKEGSFLEQDDKVMNKIIMANEWHAMLAGLENSAALGKGNTFLRTVYEQKKKTVIDPMQEFLLENLWQPLQQIAASWLGINANDYTLEIGDIDPVSLLADLDPNNFIQMDEGRAAFKLPKDTTGKGKKYIFELTQKQQKPGKEAGNDVQD